MRLSNLLLTAMIATSYGSLGQDSLSNQKLDSTSLVENHKKTTQVSIDSAFIKKVERRYAKRNKRNKNKNKLNLIPTANNSSNNKRPHFYCPGCGRG